MYTPVYTRQFERDLRLALRSGKNVEKFKILAHPRAAGTWEMIMRSLPERSGGRSGTYSIS